MVVKIINKSTNPLPKYQTSESAGADLHVFIEEDVTLKPLDRYVFPTGLYLELPKGYEAQIRGRSGLGVKYGITLANSVGTIDSDYRGEIKVCLINLSREDYTVKNGDRVAQMIITRHETCEFVEVEAISDSDRGKGGFGSTGVSK